MNMPLFDILVAKQGIAEAGLQVKRSGGIAAQEKQLFAQFMMFRDNFGPPLEKGARRLQHNSDSD